MKRTDIISVVEQIVNMFDNNVVGNNGSECFEGWCEDGDVFENPTDAQIKIMKRLSPFVDSLSNEIERLLDECEE